MAHELHVYCLEIHKGKTQRYHRMLGRVIIPLTKQMALNADKSEEGQTVD